MVSYLQGNTVGKLELQGMLMPQCKQRFSLLLLVLKVLSFGPSKKVLVGKSAKSKELLHNFIQKKSATEAHKILVETYNEPVVSERTCRDWSRRFKNKDFNLKDNMRFSSAFRGISRV
ncbi:hypothetical protein NPIL_224661 [Nephila pilipes]|uniref:Mos1 transposase HTH domain-containing protein n=1 Tax=Nephila pilipes TaxID=299642 RepID=A0A8X6P1L4_NEPPI|nr:hypothetical protein NPIL_224661 [Nephila pilipes]